MPEQTESQHKGEFIVSEANGTLSRESVIILSGESLLPGNVLGKVTASGKYKEYNPDNTDGSQTAVAISLDVVDASTADKEAVIIARDAEVNKVELIWFTGATDVEKAAGLFNLATVSIIGR